jgi:hypothetical protein
MESLLAAKAADAPTRSPMNRQPLGDGDQEAAGSFYNQIKNEAHNNVYLVFWSE